MQLHSDSGSCCILNTIRSMEREESNRNIYHIYKNVFVYVKAIHMKILLTPLLPKSILGWITKFQYPYCDVKMEQVCLFLLIIIEKWVSSWPSFQSTVWHKCGNLESYCGCLIHSPCWNCLSTDSLLLSLLCSVFEVWH